MKPMLLAFAVTIVMTVAAPPVLSMFSFSTETQTTTPGVRLD